MQALRLMAVLGTAFSLIGAAAYAAALPGGAGSLSESYQDWQVNCVIAEAGARCAMAQVQADPKTRQRVLGIELQVAPDGAVSGALFMPFGLELGRGVTLQVDDNARGSAMRFSTCLPAGCIVPLALDGTITTALQRGATLTINAVANDTRRPLAFTVPLKGFAAALARVRDLVR